LILQNDPYRLEDMMKEIETPEKVSPLPAKNPDRITEIRSETAKLTKAMVQENKRLETKEEWKVVNYIGTDVMGDSRYLVAVPLLAALGFKVPSIQVGNNISMEKLKCIPGFNPELTLDQMNSMIENIGCFCGYSQDLNLVESKMNLIMKSVGTFQSSQLDLARFFSLTAACGTTHCFGDVKCRGKRDQTAVFKQAGDITSLTRELGIKCRVHVSDSTVPYSRMLGYPLEIQDVVEILSGDGSSDVLDVLALQCSHLLQMSGRVESLKDGEKMVLDVLAKGEGLTKFLEMLAAQGVSRDHVEKLRARKYDEVLTRAGYQTRVESRFPGIVRDIRLDNLERVLTNRLGGYGGGGPGIEVSVDIGSKVNVGTCLAIIHHSEETLAPKIKNVVYTAFDIEKVQFNRIIRTFRNDESDKKQQRKNRNSKSGSKSDTDKQDKKADKDERNEAVQSSASSESVPKDYVVVVNTENGEERTVIEKKD